MTPSYDYTHAVPFDDSRMACTAQGLIFACALLYPPSIPGHCFHTHLYLLFLCHRSLAILMVTVLGGLADTSAAPVAAVWVSPTRTAYIDPM